MDTILIVDDNKDVLNILSEGLEIYNSQFKVMTAFDGSEAVKILNEHTISLVVTDLMMPNIGGLQLIAYMSNNFQAIPCIVMAGSGAAKIDDNFMRKGVLRCIEKPFKIKDIASLIIGGLDLVDEGATRNGIALSGFLALIEMEQLSCHLKIKSATTVSGLLYFERGIVWGGSYRELKPEEAAIEMLTWDKVEITFLALPKNKYERSIFSNLKTLIEKAGQRKEKIEINKNLTIPENDIKVVDDPRGNQVEQEFFIELKPGQQEQVEEKLSELKRLKGFISLCVFSPGGEIVTGIYEHSEEFEQIGDFIFDSVGKAQKIFKILKLGPCDIIDITGDEGRHLLVKTYQRYNINYIVMLICRGDAETEIFKHYLCLTVPALADYLKIR